MSDNSVPMTVIAPYIRMMKAARCMSTRSIAASSTGPRVGRPRTTDTIRLPLTRAGSR